jgi:multiple antibiotic resistance protein
MTRDTLPYAKLTALAFMMMGPAGVMPIFANLLSGADKQKERAVAYRAFAFASAAAVVAIFVGTGALESWGISRPSLIIAAGLLLLLSTVGRLIGNGDLPCPARTQADISIALSPLAFPTIISPAGIGVVIIFVAYFPSFAHKVAILAIMLAIIAVDLIAMLYARRVMTIIGPVPLAVLGAVFGVLQTAFGIEAMASGMLLYR